MRRPSFAQPYVALASQHIRRELHTFVPRTQLAELGTDRPTRRRGVAAVRMSLAAP
ncbi:hypothetical protein ACIBL5_34805 [Streptomyces sp. NPDC050516]|uniref:hypothetical protein n=1 Tax=Streptomyces sp. NPDC050516 TaxID=3365621 RepID=UPI0037B2E44E